VSFLLYTRAGVNVYRIPRNDSAPPGIKGKAIPLQALAGPESFRRLRLPDFKTIGT
jgi:hypothetical protein